MAKDVKPANGAKQLKYQPNRTAFIATRLWGTAVGFTVFTVAAIVAVNTVDPRIAWAIVLFVFLAGFDVADTFVSFKKQRYEFGDSATYYGDGHLFTDRDTELRFANITHVRVIKPFLEYRLFGTGKILIESAGSKGATVEMKSIDKPYETFEQIRRLLAENTFSLTYGELLSQKKPSPLAVMLQLLGGAFAAIAFAIFSIGVTTIISIISDIPPVLFTILLPLLALAILIYLYAAYQDQLRRTYYVYGDVIHYSKGFLTRQEAFIPAGNLANTRLTQNFIGKLLNLQDVVVSCQGQGSEINFANLRDGESMQRAITGLINHRKTLRSEETKKSQAKPTSVASTKDQIVKTFTAAPTPAGDDTKAQDFSMHMQRAMWAYAPIYPLLLLVIPVLIAVLVRQYIAAKRTVYRLTDGGVASYYTFLTTKNVEFSRDKITGLVIKRNPLDRYFNTCTVSFWSIGSGAAVDFQHIPYDDNLENLMRAKAGIIDDEELEVVKPQFSLGAMFKAKLVTVILAALLFSASLVLVWWLSLWFMVLTVALVAALTTAIIILHRRYRRAWLRFGQHTVTLNLGVLFNKTFYARHDNVKDVTLTKYPKSTLGQIQFNVAGERTVNDSNGNKSTLPNRFSISYIPGVVADVRGQRTWLDQILLHKPSAKKYAALIGANAKTPSVRSQARPSLKNSLAVIIPLHIILIPLIVILPFTILLRRYWLRRVDYHIEDDRVLMRSGVIYRKQTSILYTRLDYTETGQNLLNKVFKNGNLYLYTAGSSKVELTLANIPDYTGFHTSLKDHSDK